MVCPQCGADSPAGSSRCTICGTVFAALGTRTSIHVLTPPPDSDDPTTLGRAPDPSAVTRLEAGTTNPAGTSGTASRFVPGGTVAGRYHIIRLLGVGGMGAVYQAWDDTLGIAVALKVILPAESSDDPHVNAARERRFKRELLLARQVTHKNVVRIHDFGEVDGTAYITMPFIHGSNLAAILAAEGKLPVERTLHVARQIAAGLAAAHEAGVVHRDLKPANIMVETEDDRALIMDFGIARSTDAQTALATRTGGVVGTLEYMAPEQAEGRPVDQRCDLYAFGLIVYDLVTGGRRSSGSSAVADLMQRLQKPLPAVRTLNPAVPEPLAAVIDRCLQRDPAARYQTSAELVAALDALDDRGQLRPAARRRSTVRDVVLAIVIAALATAAVWLWRSRPASAPAAAKQEPISVLIADFDNRANDPVFDGSIEQALGIGLEGASFISAVPRAAAHRLAAQLGSARLDEAAARLISVRDGIKFVLAGAIEPSAAGYAIAARLIDPAVGTTVKTARTSARSKGDVLQAVGALAANLRRDLGDTKPESARLAASETFTTSSLDAVREYTIAQDLANNSRNEAAIPHYQKAVAADPQFGRAYSGWALSLYELGRQEDAAAQWTKALALMDRMTDRERYRTMGTYNLAIARNYRQAVENYSKLVELYPADRSGHNNLAFAYFNLLDIAKARDEQQKAVAIYKGSFKFRNNAVLYEMYAGSFDAAVDGARQLIKEDPKFTDAYVPLAIALSAKGDRAGARSTWEAMAATGPVGASAAAMGLADLDLVEGRWAAAEARLLGSVSADESVRNTVGRGSKLVALAEADQAQGKSAAALDAGRRALAATHQEFVAVPAARILAANGRVADARALATELERNLQTQTRAYAQIIDGEIALQQDRLTDAVQAFQAASRQYDVWLAHFDLGVAYVRAGHFTEALAELDLCAKRRGEATAIFLDDVPTLRYLVPLAYWHGRAQEGVGMKGAAAENYKAYLAIRPAATGEPLAVDAQRRITGT
jgi:tetratricopeptide (TPR) repeat protein